MQLVVNSRAAHLFQKLNSIWLWWSAILEAFIAISARCAKIVGRLLAAFGFVNNMPHREALLAEATSWSIFQARVGPFVDRV